MLPEPRLAGLKQHLSEAHFLLDVMQQLLYPNFLDHGLMCEPLLLLHSENVIALEQDFGFRGIFLAKS